MRDPAKRLASKAAYRSRNRSNLAEKQRQYRHTNREFVRMLDAAYREKHHDEVLQRKKDYRLRNPDKVSAARQRRRALERGAVGQASAEELQARHAFYGFRCWVCKGPAEATDHVLALCRGGSAWPANLRPICTTCNLAKLRLDKAGSSVSEILSWARERYTDMEAARERVAWMDRVLEEGGGPL